MSIATLSPTLFGLFFATGPTYERQYTRNSTKFTARLAGVFYLLVGVLGGFAVGFVEPKMYAARDAVITTETILANEGLVRMGVAADLLNQVFFVALALTLYALLKDVRRGAARAMVAFVGVAAAIASLNAVFLFEGMQVAMDPVYTEAFGLAGMQAIVLALVDMQHFGLLAAQVFFGLWLAPLGYLAYKSGRFPRALGIILIVAAGCYLLDLLTAFIAPDLNAMIHSVVVIPCAVAEIWMVLYLLIVGTKSSSSFVAATSGEELDDENCG